MRLALTVSAIVVGVAFLAGTLVLTSTVRAAMREQAGTTAPGLDIAVFPESGFAGRNAVSSSVIDEVSHVRGVTATDGEVQGAVELIGPHEAGVDGTAVSVALRAGFQTLELEHGHFPRAADELVVDDHTASAQHWRLGETIQVAAAGSSAHAFTLVGISKADAAQGLTGTTVAGFTLQEAQRLLAMPGRYSEIEVSTAPGTDEAAEARTVSSLLGHGFQVLTASQLQARAVAADFKSFSLLSTILVMLGAIVLFVAAFLVVNTFSIVVAQRTRELGLLRCLGASRRQLMGSVLAESFLVGLVASCVGVVLGIAVAVVLLAVLPGLGLDLPSVTPAIHAVSVLAPVGLGTAATLLASVFPALRSTAVPPVAALRDDLVSDAGQRHSHRAAIGTSTFLVGVGLLLGGLFAGMNHEGYYVGAGAVLAFVGLASLSPLAARPLALVLGWPLVALRGLPAGLARENAMRNPRRTASTAAALLVGVALVSFMAVITASARASATENITSALRVGYVVQGNGQGSVGLGSGLLPRLRAEKDLASVVPVSYVRFDAGGFPSSGFVVDPRTYPTVVSLGAVDGHFEMLGGDTMAVSQLVAASNGWRLGESVPVDFGNGTRVDVRIVALFPVGDSFGGILFSSVHPPSDLSGYTVSRIFVEGRQGLAPALVTAAIARASTGYPRAHTDTESALVTTNVGQVDQIVNLITVILILAVLIGLVGIVNTLALSVMERKRELGLLRALGMSRAQVRTMVRHESVIVSLLGAVAGIVVGLLLAWAMQHSLYDQGLVQLRFPVPTLLAYVFGAGVCGIVAGIIPARRAADLDILGAIAAE